MHFDKIVSNMKKNMNYRIGKLLRLGFSIVPETQIELRYPFFFPKGQDFLKTHLCVTQSTQSEEPASLSKVM